MNPDRLAALPLFASLSTDDMARVADAMEPVSVATGEALCLQGEFAYQFFVIEEGTAEVMMDGRRVAELSAGDWFGETGLLVTGRRVASVVACSPMRLFVIFEQPFHRLVRDLPDLAERIREVLPHRPWLPTPSARAEVAAPAQPGERS
jgi:CRP-like cAMP-binding protein